MNRGRASKTAYKTLKINFAIGKMHTDLSPHLHTPECNKLIDALKNCHTEHTFGKFVGICNSIDTALVKCLKTERVARSAANRAKARERQAAVRERMQTNT